MGDKSIVRAKMVFDPNEEKLNEALKKLDKHYIVSVFPLFQGNVCITYAVKVSKRHYDDGEDEEGEE